MHAIRSCCRRARCALAVLLFAATGAAAAGFPASGTISVNGNSAALPQGGMFADASYDGASGVITPGAFAFPQSSISFDSQLGPVVAVYELSQTDSSSGDVASDGVAVLSITTMKLRIVSATLLGFPISLGTCIFQPIGMLLAGTGSAGGLDLSDPGFTIPPVASGDCGGHGDAINAGIAGGQNAIVLHLAGDFTPPLDLDAIFENGFEAPGTNQATH